MLGCCNDRRALLHANSTADVLCYVVLRRMDNRCKIASGDKINCLISLCKYTKTTALVFGRKHTYDVNIDSSSILVRSRKHTNDVIFIVKCHLKFVAELLKPLTNRTKQSGLSQKCYDVDDTFQLITRYGAITIN